MLCFCALWAPVIKDYRVNHHSIDEIQRSKTKATVGIVWTCQSFVSKLYTKFTHSVNMQANHVFIYSNDTKRVHIHCTYKHKT